MPNSINYARAASVLNTYATMIRDLRIRPTPVLRARLADCEAELLSLTGAASVEDARRRIGRATSTGKQSAMHHKKAKKKAKTAMSGGRCRCRYCTDSDRLWVKPPVRALPTRITSVVSGGLPASSRRH